MTLSMQITVVIFLIWLSAFFAGSETGVYRLSRIRLRLGLQQRKPLYKLLAGIIHDSHGLMISLLIGNNIANYLTTSIVTYMLLSQIDNPHQAEFYATLIMTPVLFVFVDIIPKSVYYYRSDKIMPRLSPILWIFYELFRWSGFVAFLKIMSRGINRLFGSSGDAGAAIAATGRHRIKQIIHETREEGILSPLQQDIMHSLVDAPNILISQVMLPLEKVQMLPLNSNRETLLIKLKESSYARLPVYEERRNNVLGFVNIYKILAQETEFEILTEFLEDIAEYKSSISVIDAINSMRKLEQKIAVVSDEHRHGRKQTLGIITLADLVEQLTGKLSHA